MNRTTTLLASTILSLGLAASSAALAVGSNNAAQQITPASTSHNKDAQQFVFTMVLHDATLTHLKGKSYALSMDIKDIANITAMSLPPHQNTIQMTPDEFSKMAHSGPNSFDKNPPNLSLSMPNLPQAAYTLVGYKKTNTTLTYQLKLLGDKGGPQNTVTGRAMLFIDGSAWDY